MTGVVFLLVGVAFCIASGRAYHFARKAIDAGRYEPLHRIVTALTVLVVLGGQVNTGLVIWQLCDPGAI